MKTQTKIVSIAAALLILSSCVKKPKIGSGPDYMVLDEVVFVTKFPQTIDINNPERIETEVPGGLDFVIQDSLIIFSTKNPDAMWNFFSLPNFKYLGGYLVKGRGPKELLQTPWLYETSFSKENRQLFAQIYDFDNGKLLQINIGQTLRDNNLSMSVVTASLPATLFNFVVLDNDTFFCRELSEDWTQQNRYMLKDGVKSIPENLKKLNQSRISQGEDVNIMKTIIKYNPTIKRLVEVPIDLNYINIYTVDGSFGKTVCVEEKIDNISEIQLLDKRERRSTFGSVRIYDNMFGVRWKGDNDVSQEDALSKIMFFDMDGKPLLELKPDRPFTTFDIDFKRGHLYTHSYQTEDLYKYDIGKYLGELK